MDTKVTMCALYRRLSAIAPKMGLVVIFVDTDMTLGTKTLGMILTHLCHKTSSINNFCACAVTTKLKIYDIYCPLSTVAPKIG